MAVQLGPFSWERMIRAVEKVRERLERATAALEAAAVPYAVIGGNAVAAWVSRVDPSAVRNTADVDLLLRRSDIEEAEPQLRLAGLAPLHPKDLSTYRDVTRGGPRDVVNLRFVEDIGTTADLDEAVHTAQGYRVVTLSTLVRMKLEVFRAKDRMHLHDLIAVGLVDQTWTGRVPPGLAPRLQTLLDDPNG
jgi:hypothetical protein